MLKPKRFFIYITIFISAFLVFLVIRFPQENIGEHLSAKLSEKIPGIRLASDRAVLSLPPSVTLINPRLVFQNLPVSFDSFTIKLALLKLLKGNFQLAYTAKVLQGEITGTLNLASRNAPQKLTISGLNLTDIDYTASNAAARIKMTVDGNIIFPQNEPPDLFEGDLILSDVAARMTNSVFNLMGIDLVTFSQIDLRFHMTGTHFTIPKCIASGKIMSLRLKGRVTPLKKDIHSLSDLSLDLQGFIQPQPAYMNKFAGISSMAVLFEDNSKKGIPIRISGTMAQPEVAL